LQVEEGQPPDLTLRGGFHPSLALPTVKAASRKVDTSFAQKSKRMRIDADRPAAVHHEALIEQQVLRSSANIFTKSKNNDEACSGSRSGAEDSIPSKPQFMCSQASARDDDVLLSLCGSIAEGGSSVVDSRPCYGSSSHASSSANSISVADPPNTGDGMDMLGEECLYQVGDKPVLNCCDDVEYLDGGADGVGGCDMDVDNFPSLGCKASLSNMSTFVEPCGSVFSSVDDQNGKKSWAALCAPKGQTSEPVNLEGGPDNTKPSIPSTIQTESDVVHGQIWRTKSIDGWLPDQPGQHGVFVHISKERLQNMQSNNLLSLCKQESYLQNLSQQLSLASNQHGLSASPHLSDLAGKLPLALKLMSLGLAASNIIIDAAHAHGPCLSADGFLVDAASFLEVKGSGPKHRPNPPRSSSWNRQYTIHNLRLTSDWQVLMIVPRPQDPGDWTRAENFDEFWLGVVTRKEFMEVASEGWDGISPKAKSFVITPGIPESRFSRSTRRSPLSKIIRWVKFRDLTAEWWQENVLKQLNVNRHPQIPEPDL